MQRHTDNTYKVRLKMTEQKCDHQILYACVAVAQ